MNKPYQSSHPDKSPLHPTTCEIPAIDPHSPLLALQTLAGYFPPSYGCILFAPESISLPTVGEFAPPARFFYLQSLISQLVNPNTDPPLLFLFPLYLFLNGFELVFLFSCSTSLIKLKAIDFPSGVG